MVWLASGLAWFTRYFIQHENRASHEPPRPAELWLLLNKSGHLGQGFSLIDSKLIKAVYLEKHSS